jgi:hypothetical protein
VGANGLIGAIGTPLGDCFLGNILGKSFQKSLKFILKISLYYFIKFCVKKLPKVCHFQSFPSPLLLKTMVTSFFTLLLRVQMLMK